MPYDTRPSTAVSRFAAASVLTTISLIGLAIFIVKGAPGRAIQQWKNSAGTIVCELGSGGLLSGNCTTGLGGSVNTGALLSSFDKRYYLLQGGRVGTGALRVRNTLSGSSLEIDGLSNCTNVQTNSSGVASCNAASYQTTALADDKTWVGNGTAQATTLPSCSNGTTNALEYNVSTNAYSCVTISSGTAYTAAQGLTLTSNAFNVNASLSGTLLRFQTVSGSILRADAQIVDSGSLVVKGTTTLKNTQSCTTLQTSSTGLVSCNNSVQPLDATLTSLAAYNTNGLLTQTAADTFTGRTLTGPAAGINVANGDGVSGNPTLSLTNDLSAVEGLSSNGVTVRTATDTWTTRTITGTSNRISMSNGDGVSGNPTIDISASYVGQTSITTLGTLTTSPIAGISLNVGGLGSGRTLHAQDVLRSSGTLLVSGNATIHSLSSCTNVQSTTAGLLSCNNTAYQTTALADDNTWVGNGTAQAVALPSCSNGSTNALEYNTSTNAYSCVSISGGSNYFAGQGITINGSNVISLNATNSGSLSDYTTQSGSKVRALTQLTSSGTFVVEGAATLENSTSCTTLQTSSTGLVSCNNSVQPLDATLTSLAAYNTNGLLTQTAADTFTGRTLTGPAAGISVANGNGVSGNPTLSLVNDLSALEGLGSTGIAVRTTTDTWAQRTIVGTSNRISMTNGDGVSGNPTIDIDAAYVGQTSITTLGTLTTSPKANISLNVGGVGSGRVIRAQDALRSSGTLVVNGSVTLTNSTTCTTLQTSSTGIVSCNNSVQPLDSTLTSLAAYNTNGLLTQTAADTFTGRTVTGTSNRLSVTNGDGVSGNPTLDISASYVGQTSITTLGTLTTSPVTGTALNIAGIGSGRVVRAQDTLASSGSLVVMKRAGTSTGNTLIVDTKGLIYDATNKRVGVGNAAPGQNFEVAGTGTTTVIRWNNTAGAGKKWDWGYDSSLGYFYMDEFGVNRQIEFFNNNGRVRITNDFSLQSGKKLFFNDNDSNWIIGRDTGVITTKYNSFSDYTEVVAGNGSTEGIVVGAAGQKSFWEAVNNGGNPKQVFRGFVGINEVNGNNALTVSGSTVIGPNLPTTRVAKATLDVEGTMSGTGLNVGGTVGPTKILTGTATLDFANVAAVGCSTDLTITVTGAADGDPVSIGVPNAAQVTGGIFYGWVSAASTVSVRFCDTSSGNPASATFRAMVTHF